MYELAFSSIGAFLGFLVVLPVVGLAVGVVLRVGLPYLIGPAVIYYVLIGANTWLVILILSSIWILSILHVRERLKKIHPDLQWSEGHYYGAFNVITFAIPIRKGKTFSRKLAYSES